MTDRRPLRELLDTVSKAEQDVKAMRSEVGQRLAAVMNKVTTGDGWHALGDGAVLFAPGCELRVVIDPAAVCLWVFRRNGSTGLHAQHVQDITVLLPELRDQVNAVTRGERQHLARLLHDQPWLSAFAFWLNSYVDQIEGVP